VGGRLSLNLKDVTVREALEAIREVLRYDSVSTGTAHLRRGGRMRTRVFHVSYLSSLRTGRSDVRVSSGSTSGTIGGQPMGAGREPRRVAAGAQAGQSVNIIGLGQLNQVTNDVTRVLDFLAKRLLAGAHHRAAHPVGTGAGRSIVVSPQSGVVVVRALPQESRLRSYQPGVDERVMLRS